MARKASTGTGRRLIFAWALLALVLAAVMPHMHVVAVGDTALRTTPAGAGNGGAVPCPACLLHQSPAASSPVIVHAAADDPARSPVVADAYIALAGPEREPHLARGPPSLG